MSPLTTTIQRGDQRCVVCQSVLGSGAHGWTVRCPSCGTWTSQLQPAINESTRYDIDDEARIAGLRQLRQTNFAQLLDRVQKQRPLHGARLLDVGCAYGWFLAMAQTRGAVAAGIEPDEVIAAHAANQGLDVRSGWFPEALGSDERFDIITFNDVLEHLPDVRGALRACVAHLAPGGFLVVSIPTSDGLGYRVATLLARLGVSGPFERFWQVGLPSPHVHYFPRSALVRLLTDCDLTVVSLNAMTAMAAEGLWARVHMFRRPSLTSALGYAALRAAVPILNEPRLSDVVQIVAARA